MLTSLPFVASAFDFSAVNEDGKTIYYNVLSRTECQVVSGTSNYSGDVRIPATVSYGGNEMSVTSIGIYAFWYCTSLRSVEIPSSLTKIEESAFYGSKNLDKAEFASIGHLCSIDFSDFSSNPLSYANHLYIDGEEIFDVVIPDNVTKLSSTFSGCSYLTSVVMPSGLSNIGDYSFYECSSLTSIEIPGSVNSIGDAAFRECSSLASIDIPSSVTSIGKYAFYGCSSLIEEKIPNGVISIGLGAFQDCSKLASIEIPYSVNSIGSDAFAGCSSLTKADFTSIEHLCSIEFNGYYSNPLYSAHHLYISGDEITDLRIPSSVTVIPENVFYGCNFLTSLEIDRGVTHIGNRSFYNCSSLTSVVIPSSVTSVGNWAFSGCSSLNEVKVFAETPPSATEPTTIFGNVTKTFGTLYVPRNCKVAYETAKGWKDFIDIIEMDNDVTIIEGEAEYTNTQSKSGVNITYTRNFGNTKWQSLYVPFSMRYEDWKDDFEVAYINSVRQYDHDDDGAVDETIMDVIKINGGELYPNMPYLIKAKATGLQDIVAENATLSPTEENSISCSTMLSTFTFTGTYSTIPAAILLENNYYAMGGGTLIMTDGTSNLKPFRWYMSIESRSPMYEKPNQVRIHVIGEEDDSENRLYEIAHDEEIDEQIFNLNGLPVKDLTSGFYIKNGKKIQIK